MKKLIGLLLTVAMLCSMITGTVTCVAKEDEVDVLPGYTRPAISNYAQKAKENNKLCDVIRPDILEVAVSDNEFFSLEGKNFYGVLWNVAFNAPLTIKAKDGYTIKRVEAVVTDPRNYGELTLDKGTKGELVNIDNNSALVYIASFEDINAKSLTLSVKNGNLQDNKAVSINEFIVYYSEDQFNESVFSGGSLWIIAGVTAVAIAFAAAKIIVVKKKNEANIS